MTCPAQIIRVPTENFVCAENIEVIVFGLIVSKIHAEHRDSPADQTLGEPSQPC